jgi:hypothetical protein
MRNREPGRDMGNALRRSARCTSRTLRRAWGGCLSHTRITHASARPAAQRHHLAHLGRRPFDLSGWRSREPGVEPPAPCLHGRPRLRPISRRGARPSQARRLTELRASRWFNPTNCHSHAHLVAQANRGGLSNHSVSARSAGPTVRPSEASLPARASCEQNPVPKHASCGIALRHRTIRKEF